MILAFILAASISSTDIDEFFNVPSWMPTSVASKDTPGSSPSSGAGGWYFCDTNGEWQTKAARLTPDIQSGILSTFAGYFERQYYVSQGQSNVWDPSKYGPTSNKKQFWFSPDDRNIVTSNYTFNCSCRYGDYNELEFVDVGGGLWNVKPLFQRICNNFHWTYISHSPYCIYSTERQTYNFDFTFLIMSSIHTVDLQVQFTKMVHTNEHHQVGSEFIYRPANRTVTSRRLVQYENIDNLADYLTDDLYETSFIHKASYRPGWFFNNDSYTNCPNVWWSSSEGKIMTGTEIVPDMSNVINPTSTSAWDTCSQTIGCLNSDSIWINQTLSYKNPGPIMMSGLSFGQPSYDSGDCAPVSLVETVKELIETNFPHADGAAITNDTRRLIPDRLCCANQMLSLMDVTYSVPEVTYPSTGTNFWYQNQAICYGRASVDSCYESDGYIYCTFAQDPSCISWGNYERTNYVTKSSMPNIGKSIKHRVSKTSTNVNFILANDSLSPVRANDAMCFHFVSESAPFEGDQGFKITFCDNDGLVSVSRYLVIPVKYVVEFTKEDQSISLSGISPIYSGLITDFIAYYFYGREYWYNYVVGNAILGITQPGFEGVSRVDESRFGIVIGNHYRRISNYSLRNLDYVLGDSACRYDSFADSYSGRDGLVYKFDSYQAYIEQKLNNVYGVNPRNWQNVIPLDQSDMGSVRDSIRISSCILAAENTGWQTTYEGTCNPGLGIVNITSVVSSKSGEVDVGGEVDLVNVALSFTAENDRPGQEESEPISMDSKIGIITKVKWKWKTLKRTE